MTVKVTLTLLDDTVVDLTVEPGELEVERVTVAEPVLFNNQPGMAYLEGDAQWRITYRRYTTYRCKSFLVEPITRCPKCNDRGTRYIRRGDDEWDAEECDCLDLR